MSISLKDSSTSFFWLFWELRDSLLMIVTSTVRELRLKELLSPLTYFGKILVLAQRKEYLECAWHILFHFYFLVLLLASTGVWTLRSNRWRNQPDLNSEQIQLFFGVFELSPLWCLSCVPSSMWLWLYLFENFQQRKSISPILDSISQPHSSSSQLCSWTHASSLFWSILEERTGLRTQVLWMTFSITLFLRLFLTRHYISSI